MKNVNKMTGLIVMILICTTFIGVGIGYGGPVIKDGKVCLLDRDKGTGDILRCFDFSNGKELWRFGYDAPGSVMFPGSRSVPAVDGNHVYSCGQNGDLYCININTHKSVWNKNVWTDFGGDRLPIWAITQYPLIYGENDIPLTKNYILTLADNLSYDFSSISV